MIPIIIYTVLGIAVFTVFIVVCHLPVYFWILALRRATNGNRQQNLMLEAGQQGQRTAEDDVQQELEEITAQNEAILGEASEVVKDRSNNRHRANIQRRTYIGDVKYFFRHEYRNMSRLLALVKSLFWTRILANHGHTRLAGQLQGWNLLAFKT